MTTEILDRLFDAADNHGDDSGEFDHTFGDLQGLLREAWRLMNPSQRFALLESSEVEDLVEVGARDEFTVGDLTTQLEAEVAKMEKAVAAAGYVFLEGEYGFSWESATEDYGYFEAREDAVANAYAHLQASVT